MSSDAGEKEQMLPIGEAGSDHAFEVYTEFKDWAIYQLVILIITLLLFIVFFLTGLVVLAVVVILLWLGLVVAILLLIGLGSNGFQLWALQRPSNPVSKLILWPVAYAEGAVIGRYTAGMGEQVPPVEQLRLDWGSNFCAAGQVWLGSHKDVSEQLTRPQARSCWLGEHRLLGDNLPNAQHTRCVFMLSHSDKEATGSGSHEMLRSALKSAIFNEQLEARMGDETSQKLFDQLAKDYMEMPHGVSEAFFEESSKGLLGFVIKYLHYALFGIDPNNEQIQSKLLSVYGSPSATGYYEEPLGLFLRDDYGPKVSAVTDVYKNTSVLGAFVEHNPAHHNLTSNEVAALCAAVLQLVGVQGTYILLRTLMGGDYMPVYPQAQYQPIDVVPIWDRLRLGHDLDVQLHIMEVSRLRAPVPVSHRVATQDFTCEINGKSVKFPRGTPIAVPICLASTDPEFWGEDAFDYNRLRPGLEENWMNFNSVGGKHHNRECLAKDLVMDVATRVLREVGRARRGGSWRASA